MAFKKLEAIKGADGFPLKGTFVFPKLNTPDTKFKAEGEYQVRLRMGADDAAPIMAKIDEMADAALAEAKAELVKAKKGAAAAKLTLAKDKPYRPTMDPETGEETGDIEFNFKMKASGVAAATGKPWERSPKVFSASGAELKGTAIPSIWGGTVGRVSGEYNPFCTAIGAGVSLRLNAVQILSLVTKGGGDAGTFGFGAEEGFEPAAPDATGEGFPSDPDAPDADVPQAADTGARPQF